MKNKYYLLTGLIGLLVTTAIIGSVSQAGFNQEARSEIDSAKLEEIKERRLEIKNIFETEDYNAWQELMNEKANKLEETAENIRENITQDNFETMIEIHTLMEEGNREEARELMQELREETGLGGHGFGKKPGFRGQK